MLYFFIWLINKINAKRATLAYLKIRRTRRACNALESNLLSTANLKRARPRINPFIHGEPQASQCTHESTATQCQRVDSRAGKRELRSHSSPTRAAVLSYKKEPKNFYMRCGEGGKTSLLAFSPPSPPRPPISLFLSRL